jgi:hypothetical protein
MAKIKVEIERCASPHSVIFYFPQRAEESTLWISKRVTKKQFLRYSKIPELREKAINNIGICCFEIIEEIMQQLEVYEVTLTVYSDQEARELLVTKEDHVAWETLTPKITRIIKKVYSKHRKN